MMSMRFSIDVPRAAIRPRVLVCPLVALATGLVVAVSPAAQAQQAPPPPTVTVAHPLEKTVTMWDEYSGRSVAVSRVELRARVSGYIQEVHFKDGAIVKEGDLLFTIDKRPFTLAVKAAQANVARQQAQVDFGKAEVDRARPLARSRVLSEQNFEQREATFASAQASLLAARAELSQAELNLEWAEVRAPIAGRISDRKVDPGNLIAGGQSGATLLATIVSTHPIYFVFDASEADYLRYSRLFLSGTRPSSRDAANPVRLRLADETKWSREGHMDFVDNALNESSGTMRGRAIFDNKDGLLVPGMFARVDLFGGERKAVLIPDESIVSDQAQKAVYTIKDDGTLVSTPVTLGPITEGLRLIESGVTAKDKIVIGGLANPAVRPGAKVNVEDGKITTEAGNE